MRPIRLLLCSVWMVVAAAAAPSREQLAREKVANQCQKDLWVCSSHSRISLEAPLQQPQSKIPCAQHNLPFITFHRNPILQDFDDFFDAIASSSSSLSMSEIPSRPHLRGSVHVMMYSIQTTHSSIMVSSSGWLVSSPELPKLPLLEPSSDKLMTQRRRLLETGPLVSSSETEQPHILSDQELMCLKNYVLDDRIWGSSSCIEAMEEWQAIQKESLLMASRMTQVTQASTTNPSVALLQKKRFHRIFYLMNMLCLLTLWIISGLLCVSCVDAEEEEPDNFVDEKESNLASLSLRTVLSVPKNEDEPMVYVGVPLRIV